MMRINALFPEARELFVARELAPAGLRSGPKNPGSASHSSGSKLPHHKRTLAAG